MGLQELVDNLSDSKMRMNHTDVIAEDENKIVAVAYIATVTADSNIEDEMSSIFEVANEQNPMYFITGFLTHKKITPQIALAFQYLEGEEGNVSQLYKNITGDPRLRGLINFANCVPIKKRFFPNWNMINVSDMYFPDDLFKAPDFENKVNSLEEKIRAMNDETRFVED